MRKPTICQIILAALLLTIVFLSPVQATEEFAAQTARECQTCHLDPLGGGPLTAIGQGFLLSIRPASQPQAEPGLFASRPLRLLFGYLHIITAFMWFGTILYVHLVLKPAYASQGLPRGEVKVGLISMAVMAITGIVLTYYKVPSLDMLLSSRFGILLLIKITLFTIMVASALFVVLVIGPKLKKKHALPPKDASLLSLEELSACDGEEGRPAYVAYKGKIYDVTSSKLWKGGSHMKRHQAGIDLTAILAQAPHEEDKILAMPLVGQLAAKPTTTVKDRRERVFYFMAYMNLGFVFIIAFILALWRWY